MRHSSDAREKIGIGLVYPVALNLAGKTCIVVGGGTVATRKIAGLLEASAQVIVISPAVMATLHERVSTGKIKWINQVYQPGCLEPHAPFIVIAATNQPEVNRQVADDARAIGALVNVVDRSTDSDFHNMTLLHRPPITVAVHTNGAPVLSHHLLNIVDRAIGDEYATLADWLGELRPQIKQRIASQPQRQALYEAVVHSDALMLLRQGETEAAHRHVQNLVQEWTCTH